MSEEDIEDIQDLQKLEETKRSHAEKMETIRYVSRNNKQTNKQANDMNRSSSLIHKILGSFLNLQEQEAQIAMAGNRES